MVERAYPLGTGVEAVEQLSKDEGRERQSPGLGHGVGAFHEATGKADVEGHDGCDARLGAGLDDIGDVRLEGCVSAFVFHYRRIADLLGTRPDKT